MRALPVKRPLATLALGAALCAPAQAQAADRVAAINLHDAIALAEEHNPDFKSTGYDVQAAEGAMVQASLLPNPSFEVSSYGRTLKPLQGPVPTQFGVGFTVPISGRIGLAKDSAEAAVDAAKQTREQARRQLHFDVQTAFITLQLQQLLESFSEQDQKGFHQELELNELRYKDGKISFGDLLKLRIQAVTTDDEVTEAKEQVQQARAELRRIVGEDVLSEDYSISGELEVPGAPATSQFESLLKTALDKRPDYQSLVANEKSNDLALTLQKRIPIPDLGFLVDYNRPQEGGNGPSYDAVLTVPIPLFDHNQGNVTQAEAALVKARLAEESLRNQIRSDLSKALQEWQAASWLLNAYQSGVVDEAKQSLDITKHAYDLGTGTLLDYLDAEQSYRQIESAYRSSLARAATAARNLHFITGEVQP